MIPRISPNYNCRDMARCFLPARKDAVHLLEEQFVERTGHAAAIAFRYGRSGLYFLLKALGAKDKKVIMPAYTCVVVAHAVVLSGNIPVFLDNRPDGFQPNPMSYLDAIDDDTVMIIPTHLFGIAEETITLYREVTLRYPRVFVLQDCAHSFFCRDSTGEPVTTYGDGALFGMNISKLVNSVHGGMLTFRDRKLAGEVRRLQDEAASTGKQRRYPALQERAYAIAAGIGFDPRVYSAVRAIQGATRLLESEVCYYHPAEVDLPANFTTRLMPIQAEIGLRSAHKFDSRVARRREIAGWYLEKLSGEARSVGLRLPLGSPWHTWSHFPIMVPGDRRNELRSTIQARFRMELGVVVDYSIPDLPAYAAGDLPDCPIASRTAREVLNLPLTFQEGLLPQRAWKSSTERLATAILSELGSGSVSDQ